MAEDPAPPLPAWLEAAWAQPAEVRAVEVEGAIVRYRAWGMAPATKPALLLAHGFIAHARWWDHIAPHFADRYRVVAPDFTGMGDSDRRPTYSRRQYARELIATARDAGMERATFVAHSFGAAAALYAAMTEPDLVERVIVIDARVFRPKMEEPTPVQPEKFYPSFEAAFERYRLMPPGEWPDPHVLAYVARHSIRQVADGVWGWKFDPETFRTVHRETLGQAFEGLALPVDFIHAENSDVVGPVELADFLDRMPGCGPAVTVPLSHHHVMIEQPVGLVAALNGLLARPWAAPAHRV